MLRSYYGWLVAATLVVAPAAAHASTLFAPVPDVRTTLVLRLFGEVSDAHASPLTIGTIVAESPLREAAFVVHIDSNAAPAHQAVAVVAQEAVQPASRLAFVPASPSVEPTRLQRTVAREPNRVTFGTTMAVTAAYEAIPPSLFSSDTNASTYLFPSAPTRAIPGLLSSSALDDGSSAGAALDRSVQVPVALRVGNLRLLAAFNAGLGSVQSSGIDNTMPDFVPSYAGVSRSTLGADLAVPVAPRLLLGVGYNTERLVTGYGMPTGLDGLDARNDTYSGNVTFLFPRLSSALSLSAQQYRYQDNVMPAEFTQLREDLNLTVKF
jgi:hypothetical protein